MSSPVFKFDGEDPRMLQAYADARRSFRYFWRELSWERRRIVPGLDLAMVKLPFTDGPRTDGQPSCEHMWAGDVRFDGVTVRATLANQPNWVTSVKKGDDVAVPLAALSDWLAVCDGRAWGGHTVQAMRRTMTARERKSHDDAWGLDFGDPAQVRLEPPAKPNRPTQSSGFFARLFGGATKAEAPPAAAESEVFRDHPMGVNMLPKLEEFLRNDPTAAIRPDDEGWTMLHREALAGNLGVVKLLLQHGADASAKLPDGRTAAVLARQIGWDAIAGFLENPAR